MARSATVVRLPTRRNRVNRLLSRAESQKRPVEIDPALSKLLDLIQASPMSYAAICDKSGVSRACIRRWELGLTKKPFGITMDMVAQAIGYRRGDWQRL